MADTETLGLLRDALQLFNDRPSFGLRRDPRTTSYRVAARIDSHLAALSVARAHPAIAAARRHWSDDPLVEVDEDESTISIGTEGVWVRAWAFVPQDRCDGPDDRSG